VQENNLRKERFILPHGFRKSLVHGFLAPLAWAEDHGRESMWQRNFFTFSWTGNTEQEEKVVRARYSLPKNSSPQ
jgi:hypothetical protein